MVNRTEWRTQKLFAFFEREKEKEREREREQAGEGQRRRRERILSRLHAQHRAQHGLDLTTMRS